MSNFIFWGLFLFLAAIVVAYWLWMIWSERGKQ